ncbi:hypothetical protein V7201_11715 [Bacillus sp. JJ1122]|uniref:hypothetical protein n=1 Tax=Bacillus sp. JJ1122 TaxID=3122951 RepID=UPI0030002FDB
MGKIISFIITLIIIGIINIGITVVTEISFIDASAFVGLVSTVAIYLFTSSGGFTSRNLDMQVQAQTGFKINQSDIKFSPSYSFFASIIYLVGAIIATFIMYKEYFI